jgi:methylenetetrahydrofolate--tRNA-(uracil-5-)-methyltransferase
LLAHVTGGHLESGAQSFQPMNVNFGLFPPLDGGTERGRERKRALAERALRDLEAWLDTSSLIAAQ